MKFYKYIYYKLYQLTEPMGFWPEYRAGLLMIFLNIAFLSIFTSYYIILTKTRIPPLISDVLVYALPTFLAIFNYNLFLHKNRWKQIVKEFDKLSMKQDLIGGLLIWTLIVAICVYSIYLIYQLPV